MLILIGCMIVLASIYGGFSLADGKTLPQFFFGSKYNRTIDEELLSLLYCLLAKVRTDGSIAIASDVQAPEKSPIFSHFPNILGQYQIVEFLTHNLGQLVTGTLQSPSATMPEPLQNHDRRAFNCIKATLIAYKNDDLPKHAVALGRKVLYSNEYLAPVRSLALVIPGKLRQQ